MHAHKTPLSRLSQYWRKALTLSAWFCFSLSMGLSVPGCVPLQSIPGMEELSYQQLLQKGFGNLTEFLAYYYPLTTSEFKVLQDPILASALQQNGAAVCVHEPCSPQAILLQGYACQDVEQDFMLLELMTADLTLQRLYKIQPQAQGTPIFTPAPVQGLQSDIAPQSNPQLATNNNRHSLQEAASSATTSSAQTQSTNVTLASTTKTNSATKTKAMSKSSAHQVNQANQATLEGQTKTLTSINSSETANAHANGTNITHASNGAGWAPDATLRVYGPVSVITNLPAHLPVPVNL